MSRQKSFEAEALQHLACAQTLAYWLVRDRSDAEDIVQDAYLRAYRAFDQCTGEDVKPWLLRIVRNVAYRWLAARARNANVVSLDAGLDGDADDGPGPPQIAASEPSAESVLMAKDEAALLMHALGELAPVFREALILRELEELSYAEIAQVAGVPIGTVMSRLARGREQLRAILTTRTRKGMSR